MFTAALYQWSVAASPVNIFLDIPLADRLRTAAASSEVEIGGFLVGHLEDKKTIVTDFELVDSEHRRGTAYSLSRRDDQHLIAKLEASRKKKREVVGFFRSHMRPGMFLDAADESTLRGHFNNPHQVALLVRPSDDGSATGGFFYWEDGEMDRKETRLPFPLNSEELDSGKLPYAGFDSAATLDQLPRPELHAPAAAPNPVQDFAAPPRRVTIKVAVPEWIGTGWVKIGLVAAAAALCGYFFGTSGSREHFGSRPGDITIGDAAETPPPPVPAPKEIPKKVARVESEPAQPLPSNTAPPTTTVSQPPPIQPPQIRPVADRSSIPGVRVSQPDVSRHAVFEDMVRNTPPPSAVSAPPPEAQQATQSVPVVQEPVSQEPITQAPIHQAPAVAGTFPHNPNPLPPPSEAERAADASVDLEAVEDGGIKNAIHRIPLLGGLGTHHGGQDFHPPQVLRRTTPRVPAQVARELTGEVLVALKLKVDDTGRVSAVELLSRGSDRALVQLAGDAAYEWQFQPAQLKDHPVSSEVIAHFRFRPSL